MKNTGKEYMSTERTPTVREDFAELLPPLTDEQLAILEADIIENGCYAPVIVNEDLVVVDGHNRKEICDKHGIPYRMAVFSFEDDLEAKQWALDTQKSRRNLSITELCKIAMKLRPDVEARAKEQQGERTDLLTTLSKSPAIDTRKQLADAVGVGQVTMGKAMKIEDEAPVNVKEAVDSGELTINQGYNITKQVEQLPEEEQDEAAAIAIAREIENHKNRNKKIDEDTKTAKLFCGAFEKGVQIKATEANIRAWLDYAGVRFEHFDSMISEARQISDTFADIAQIIETQIKPKDWRSSDEEECDDSAEDASVSEDSDISDT